MNFFIILDVLSARNMIVHVEDIVRGIKDYYKHVGRAALRERSRLGEFPEVSLLRFIDYLIGS